MKLFNRNTDPKNAYRVTIVGYRPADNLIKWKHEYVIWSHTDFQARQAAFVKAYRAIQKLPTGLVLDVQDVTLVKEGVKRQC